MSFIIFVKNIFHLRGRGTAKLGGVERRRLGRSLYCTMQYLYIALNIRFASWAVLLRIKYLRGTFDVRHHQDISNTTAVQLHKVN